MPKSCIVCEHPKRAEIEQAILSISSETLGKAGLTVESIAEQYGIPLDVLEAHAIFHLPMDTKSTDSLTRKIKLKEADVLEEVNKEYMQTLKSLGRRINRLTEVQSSDLNEEDMQFKVAKLLTKPMVDLYVGLGGEIRQTVKTIAELDRMLNGSEDNLSTGLSALAAAIRESEPSNG